MNIERTGDYSIHLASADRRLTVWAKLDSCVEVHVFANHSTAGDVRRASDVDMLHICDFGKFLEELQDAKKQIDAWAAAR